jgi:serine/threonine protein kinase
MTEDRPENNENLKQLIAKKGIPDPDQAVRMMLTLARAVEVLHREGKIHRQINPETILLDDTMTPELLAAPPLVIFGEKLGDGLICPPLLKDNLPLSLPPEMDVVRKILTDADILLDPGQIDLYQLGAVLCFMLTGKSVSSYLRSVKTKTTVPVAFRPVLDCALGFNTKAQFKSCEAFAAELQRILDTQNTARPIRLEPALPFDHLGHYKILERIGRGGMGDVYKGYEEALDRFAAIKVLPADMGQQADFIKRFHAEAAAIAKLDHPNVIRIYYTGEDQGYHFFAMQYVEGQSLSELLARRKQLTPGEMLPIVEQCLAGLGAVHQLGLVHRDVKPGNILLDQRSNRVLVTDFGLVKLAQAKNQMTVTGMVMGTADYIAPEQARGQEIDHRADLYAVGVLMYQILSGRLPFTADTPTAMMFQHAYEPPPPLESVAPELPAPLVRLVMKLLAKDPADRHQTAQAVIEDLEKVLSPTSVGASFPHTTIIKAPCPDGISGLPANFFKRWVSKILTFLRPGKIFGLPNTTTCQMDTAISEYERQREQLQSLAKEAQAAADDLKLQIQTQALAARKADLRLPQAKSLEEKQQTLRDRQESEQTVAELSQMLAEQQEQADQIDLNLKQLDAALVGLRSQRNTLNARLDAANANLKMDGGPPPPWRFRKLAIAVIPILFLGFLSYWTYNFWSLPKKESSLIACWNFNKSKGTILPDLAGNFPGKIYGATWTKGRSGGALSLDGIDDYVDVGNDPRLELNEKSYTIEAWIKTRAAAGAIITRHFREVEREWIFGVGYDGQFIFGGSGDGLRRISGARINDGKWHHLVGVIVHRGKDDNDLYQYIDGKLDGMLTHVVDLHSTNRAVLIGDENKRTWKLTAVIDELAIFNRALSAEEVHDLYQNGINAAFLPSLPFPPDSSSGLLAYLSFDEGEGILAHDRVGQSDGKIHGATWTTGKIGGALDFDGVDNYVETPLQLVPNGKSELTMVAWVRPRPIDPKAHFMGRAQIISMDAGNCDWSILHREGKWEVFTGYRAVTLPVEVKFDTWQHIAVVFKINQEVKVYINGVRYPIGVCPASDFVVNTIMIGGNPGRWKEYYAGGIDEVRIYNRALSDGDLYQLYESKPSFFTSQKPQAYPVQKKPLPKLNVRPELIAHWTFENIQNNTLIDEGNSYVGKIHGATVAEGIKGHGLQFDGVDDFVQTNLKLPNDGSTDLTMMVWIYPTKIAGNEYLWSNMQVISTEDGDGSDWSILQHENHWQVSCGINWWDSPEPVQLNQWQHVAVVYKIGENIVIYINGRAYPTHFLPSSDFTNGLVCLGNTSGPMHENFAGKIDEVRVYKGALSSEEINDIYQNEKASDTLSGLVAAWRFDEGEGNIVHDSVGPNHGVIHGATWTRGISGNGLKFDGLKDFVSLAEPVIKTKEFSISAWARRDGRGGGVERSNPLFSQRSDPQGDNRCNIYLAVESSSESQSFASIQSSPGTGQKISCPRPKDREWHHYVLTVDPKEFTFYIDGHRIGQTPNLQTGDYGTAIDYTYIGKHRYDQMDAGFFNGVLDEVAVFDHALSPEEIQTVYRNNLRSATDQDPELDFLDQIKTNAPFTDWMNYAQIDQHLKAGKDKRLWFTGVEGRGYEGVPQFRLREEPLPTPRHIWWWWFNQDAQSMNKRIHEYSDQGYRLVYFQSFKWPDGTKRYQGIWQKLE